MEAKSSARYMDITGIRARTMFGVGPSVGCYRFDRFMLRCLRNRKRMPSDRSRVHPRWVVTYDSSMHVPDVVAIVNTSPDTVEMLR
jgi:hypothetical protein